MAGLTFYLIYGLHVRVRTLEGRLDALEVFRAGVPIEYIDSQGFTPYRKIAVDYNNNKAELRIYRSSGTSAVRSRDFIVLVDTKGMVMSAFSFSSETPHGNMLQRFGVNLTDRNGIGHN